MKRETRQTHELHLYLCILQTLLSKATYSTFRLYMFYQYVCSLGIEPTTFVLLTQCSTTEPQELQLTSAIALDEINRRFK